MRLLSLAPSHTEILFALGAESELVGVTSFCDHPEPALKLPRVPGWSTIKASDVLALKPDLVLTSSVCQESLRKELEQAGVALRHFDPRTLAEVAQSFAEVGVLVGKERAGKALGRLLLDGIEVLRRQNQGRPWRVYVEEWNNPPMAAGNWVPEMILAAGGEPFNRRLGELSGVVSWEELMEFDPEIVVYSICGLGLAFDPASLLKIEGWRDLHAARSKRVYTVDDSLFNRPGPRLLEGVKILQELISEASGTGPPCDGARLRRLR